MLSDAHGVLEKLDGVTKVNVELVWEPYWTPEKMDPRVRSLLWG
jgi:metal-sulfur cluster biosynthetic enzyme